MLLDDAAAHLDIASKFFRSATLSGWFHAPGDRLRAADFDHPDCRAIESAVGLPHEGAAAQGPDKGFLIQALLGRDRFPVEGRLTFRTSRRHYGVELRDLLEEARLQQSGRLYERFKELLAATGQRRLLDVGGRARSGTSHASDFPRHSVTVLDIRAGANVDRVGDAHALAGLFPEQHFDAFYSIATFEHLLMPWKVVLELNRVLRLGAVGFVHTHQALGLHDRPWDFWRFSDTAWDALFNRATGFAIVDRELSQAQFLLPQVYRSGKADAEAARGFEGSAVLVRKTGASRLAWPVDPGQAITTAYPDG